jgi:hypothetical protein
VASEARARGWDYVVLDGDPRLLDAFESGFGTSPTELVRSPRSFAGAPTVEIADRVASTLRELRAAAALQLVATLDGSGAATTDAAAVEAALGEGRVERLLLAYPPVPARAARAESLVRRAFDTGAEVTLVEPGLLDHGEVAALLRW